MKKKNNKGGESPLIVNLNNCGNTGQNPGCSRKTQNKNMKNIVKCPKGWNDPHVWISGQRVVLTKDEARQMAIEFYREKFTGEGLPFNIVKGLPRNHGDIQFKMLVTQGARSQDFECIYHKGDEVVGLTIEIPKASSGVSHRETLSILLSILTDTFDWDDWRDNQDEYYLTRYDTWTLPEWEKWCNERTANAQIVNDLDDLLVNFPQIFQGLYKSNIQYQTVAASPAQVILKVVCPLPGETREYMGMGLNKKAAKLSAIKKAIEDGILNEK